MFNGQLVSIVLFVSLNVYNLHASLVPVYLCFNRFVDFMHVCCASFLVFMFFYSLGQLTIYGQLSEIQFMTL